MKNDSADAAVLDVEAWDPSLAHILRDMNGQPINVHKLMARHPELLRAWWSFRNYSVAGGALGHRHGELVILRVAVHLQSWYEWASHVDRSLACGLTPEEIERVRMPTPDPLWPAQEAALLCAVDDLIATHTLAPQTRAVLTRYFSDQQIMDIVAIHGMYVILGCLLNIWQVELDAPVAARLPKQISKPCFKDAAE